MKTLFTVLPLLFVFQIHAQERKFSGTHPPDTAVLNLLKKYDDVFTYKDVAIRDARRKPLVSTGYFYHGVNGEPIDLAGLTARQTTNKFISLQDSVFDETLYQYESMAILRFKEWKIGMDKGRNFESTRSVLIVMGKENGKWVVTSEIIGQDPKPNTRSLPQKITK